MSRREGPREAWSRSRSRNESWTTEIDVSERRLPDICAFSKTGAIMITNPHILYVEGSVRELAAIMKLFQHKETLYGQWEEFKVYERTCLEEPKAVYIRFKKEHQAALLYKAINYYYQENVRGTKGHLRSYFSKQKFCYRYLQGKKCTKDHCKFLHHEPHKARYLIDGEVVNHVFDHKLAIELLFENAREIREIYREKSIDGEFGFLHPSIILERIGSTGNRKRYYSSSQQDDSGDMAPKNGRSTNSVDYDDEDEDEKLEYRPKIQQSESHSSPDHKEKSETLSKNYLSESRDDGVSRKISDFDQMMDPPKSVDVMDDRGVSSERQCPFNSGTNLEELDHDYEDLVADIAYYLQGECNEDEDDSCYNNCDVIKEQNLQYLNDPNEISEQDTAHVNLSSSRSLSREVPLSMHDHCRAWALDELDEDIAVNSGIYSHLNFVSLSSKQLLPFLEPPVPGVGKPEDQAARLSLQAVISQGADKLEVPDPSKAREFKAVSAEKSQQSTELVSVLLKDKQAVDILPKTDDLVIVGQRSEARQKAAAKNEQAEEEKLNLFVSRAQKKKERESKKKRNRKLRQEEQKANANQDVSLPSDSIDVSCIQKKQSKFDHSDEEKEICKMIEDPISQACLQSEQFPRENPLIQAVLEQDEPLQDDGEKALEDEAKADDLDDDNADKKNKKKKKKKKKAENKGSPVANKNKLSGFQEKLMAEQTLKEDLMSKQLKAKDSKIESIQAQPHQKTVESHIDYEFELAQSLNSTRGTSTLDSIIKMMDIMDSSQTNKVVIDSYSCNHACKFLFATCPK